MTYAILALILFSYVLIAYEHITRINKATIAVFAAAMGWVLFMITGTDFVLKMHGPEFQLFTDGGPFDSETVKAFIASHIFIRYGAAICSIALYLLATMNIVSVLNANGCFDFITETVRAKRRFREIAVQRHRGMMQIVIPERGDARGDG